MLMCRICLTTKEGDNITDSSCYSKLFIQMLDLKDFNDSLYLCMWCKAVLRRTMALLKLALESQEILKTQITTSFNSNQKSIHNLNYVQNYLINIVPPTESLDAEIKNENNIEEYPITILTSKEIQNNVKIEAEFEFIETNDRSNAAILENEKPVVKIKKQDNAVYKENNFEVFYLDRNEQLEEIEMKKLKYKDFKFKCDICGVGFLTKDVLDDHKIRHTKLSGSYKCDLCLVYFKSQDVLCQHRLSHRRRFKCLLCSHTCKRWIQCLSHRTKCGGVVEPTICEVCSKIFSNERSLKAHMKIHKTEKKFCCAECGKKFMRKPHLREHIRSHSGVKPFACTQCSRSFTTSSNLRAHSALHTECLQHYCVECHTYFKTEKNLKRHFKESSKHSSLGSRLYPCKECTKEFSSKKLLNCHISGQHGTEYRCKECNKTFSNNSNLKKHVKCVHTTK